MTAGVVVDCCSKTRDSNSPAPYLVAGPRRATAGSRPLSAAHLEHCSPFQGQRSLGLAKLRGPVTHISVLPTLTSGDRALAWSQQAQRHVSCQEPPGVRRVKYEGRSGGAG